LFYLDRLFVPTYILLILRLNQLHHDVPAAGHPGRSKPIELIQRQYYWPTLRKDIKQYIKNCHSCQRSHTSCYAPFGILRPLPIPYRDLEDISMDVDVGLTWSNGYNAILVVTCRLTKMRHLIACSETTTAEDVAQLYINFVFKLQGLPK